METGFGISLDNRSLLNDGDVVTGTVESDFDDRVSHIYLEADFEAQFGVQVGGRPALVAWPALSNSPLRDLTDKERSALFEVLELVHGEASATARADNLGYLRTWSG